MTVIKQFVIKFNVFKLRVITLTMNVGTYQLCFMLSFNATLESNPIKSLLLESPFSNLLLIKCDGRGTCSC